MNHSVKIGPAVAPYLSCLLLACAVREEPSSETAQHELGLTDASRYVGCFVDRHDRALPAVLATGNQTVQSCRQLARNAGWTYAGLQASGWCFGGNTIGHEQVVDAECNM